MVKSVGYGYFRGRVLVQKQGSIGGYKSVFVKLKELHNELVYPTFGGIIMNPFKGRAKFFAGDLLEFRTNDKGVRPEVYILKTYKVADAVSASTTVYIERDGYKHIPFVGDVLMVAPDVIGGTGKAVTVTAVVKTTATIGGHAVDVWQLTVSAALTIAKGKVMVEAEEAGDNKPMLVKNINAVADCDADMMFDNVADTANIGTEYEDYVDARYLYTPALGGLMYTHKMSPLPECILKLNRSNVNGWFKVNYYDMRSIPDTNYVNNAIAGVEEGIDEVSAQVSANAPKSGETDPTTATVGVIGGIYTNTTDNGVFMCVAISGEGNKTYTWKEITFVA